MTENVILYDELCRVLTDYEGNGSEDSAEHSNLYNMLVKLQHQWKECLSENVEITADTETVTSENSCGALMGWPSGTEPFECQANGCHYILIRVRKNVNFDYLYIQRQYYNAGIKRGSDFKYAGIFCKRNGRIYDGQYDIESLFSDTEALKERAAEAMENALKAAVRKAIESAIGNDRSNLRITELAGTRYIERLAQFKEYSAGDHARKAYLSSNEDEAFEFRYVCGYIPDHWTEDSILAYILDPKEYVSAEAKAYIDRHQEDMLSDFLEGDMVAEAYMAIISNLSNPVHRVRRIMRAMADSSAKTVNVTIRKDGRDFTFKTEASQFRSDCNSYYSDWSIIAADRREFERVFGRGAHYRPEDILRIDYARSTIYQAEVSENE